MAVALPDNVTGADIGSVTANAFSTAMTRKLRILTMNALERDGTDYKNDEEDSEEEEWDDVQCWKIKAHIGRQCDSDLSVEVCQEDLLDAARTAVPTVIDLEYYEGLGRRFDDQLVGQE